MEMLGMVKCWGRFIKAMKIFCFEINMEKKIKLFPLYAVKSVEWTPKINVTRFIITEVCRFWNLLFLFVFFFFVFFSEKICTPRTLLSCWQHLVSSLKNTKKKELRHNTLQNCLWHQELYYVKESSGFPFIGKFCMLKVGFLILIIEF